MHKVSKEGHSTLAKQSAQSMFVGEQQNLVSEFCSHTHVFCCGCFSDLTTVLRLLHQNSQATLPHASLELYKTRALRSRYTS